VRLFGAFLDRLRAVRILDPACGSGNFPHIALGALTDLTALAAAKGSRGIARPGPEHGPCRRTFAASGRYE